MCLAEFLSAFFNRYPVVLTSDFIRYAVGAGGVYLIVNLMLSGFLRSRKIRANTPTLKQMLAEIVFSLRTVLIFASVGTFIYMGALHGVIPIYTDVATYGWPWLIASTLILIIAHDAWFYWSHWLMHRPRFFRWFHSRHHKSHNPTPFTSYSFDASEAVVNAVYFPLILLIIPSHPIALLVFTTHMMLRNAIGHCGVEVFPARRNGRPVFDWLTTVTHHDLHHAHAGRNFGLYFTWWDRWMGTEHPRYHKEFAKAVGQDAEADWTAAARRAATSQIGFKEWL